MWRATRERQRERERGENRQKGRGEGGGYDRHGETVERGAERVGRGGDEEKERERETTLGGAAARRPAANCQTTPAVPRAVVGRPHD